MPQSAGGKKWAGPVPYALDNFAIAFELTDQVAHRYRSARVGEDRRAEFEAFGTVRQVRSLSSRSTRPQRIDA
ncbi:hypothetical protein HQO24_17940 [Rhodococcus fascians]|nr:hypothetical protein [Rhodococcus fascians]MBY4395261.1 hypothetical protein [Rhodococcus fascians]MBY4408841.1 hypothetical protein [Rhodococcus fascians]MBY4422958.1 hypothetical protein [Rhodococcus fascians]MBY4462566.1 hypothetical protein [Rhodococcus fascians]